MKALLGLLGLLFVGVCAICLSASPAPARQDARQLVTCRLAYSYDARDGILTCRQGSYYSTYYAHPWARRARRLPAGIVLTVEYVEGEGCGSGCWTRILRIE